MSTIAAILRELTGELNLSQMDIHRATEIPQPTLSRWLHGQAPDSCEQALKLLALNQQERKQAECKPVKAPKRARRKTAKRRAA